MAPTELRNEIAAGDGREGRFDFRSKYEDASRISRALVHGYFEGVRRLFAQIPVGQAKTALEVGCGEGYSTERLSGILGPGVLLQASELLGEQLEAARQRNPDLRIVQEDVNELQREDNSFDLIIMLQVLEHLSSPERALAELSRVSRRHIIVGVPREPLWRVLNVVRLKYLRSLGNTPGHVHHWSVRGFCEFVERSFGPVVAVETPIPWTLVLAERRDVAKMSGGSA